MFAGDQREAHAGVGHCQRTIRAGSSTCVELRTFGEVTGEEVSMEQRVDQARGAIPFYRGR
jgi:hypothetical protein